MTKIGAPRKLGFQVSKVDRSGNPVQVFNPITGETLSMRQYRNLTEAKERGLPTISAKQRIERKSRELGVDFVKRKFIQGEDYSIYSTPDPFSAREFILTLPDRQYVEVLFHLRKVDREGRETFSWRVFLSAEQVSSFKKRYGSDKGLDRWSQEFIDFFEDQSEYSDLGELVGVNIWASNL